MARRSKAREIALQMLFQIDLNQDVDAQAIHEMISEELQRQYPEKADNTIEELQTFAWLLFSGTSEQKQTLDEKIEAVAANWTLSRMAPTDRNVLRLGAYELLFLDTPHKVVIDEAIELARKFGTEHSAQFVNGLLDQLVPEEKREQEKQEGM